MLAALIEVNESGKGGLNHVLSDHQQNLPENTRWHRHLALVSNINEGKDWHDLVEAIELNGHIVLIVFEQNRGGSEEILYPPNSEERATEAGARQLRWFRDAVMEIDKTNQKGKHKPLTKKPSKAKVR